MGSLHTGRIEHFGTNFDQVTSPHPLHRPYEIVDRRGVGIGERALKVRQNLGMPLIHGRH